MWYGEGKKRPGGSSRSRRLLLKRGRNREGGEGEREGSCIFYTMDSYSHKQAASLFTSPVSLSLSFLRLFKKRKLGTLNTRTTSHNDVAACQIQQLVPKERKKQNCSSGLAALALLLNVVRRKRKKRIGSTD